MVSRVSRFSFTHFSALVRLTIASIALTLSSHSTGSPNNNTTGGAAANADIIATNVDVEKLLIAKIGEGGRHSDIVAVRDKIFALKSTLARVASGLPTSFVVEYSIAGLSDLPDGKKASDQLSVIPSEPGSIDYRVGVLARLKEQSRIAQERAEISLGATQQLNGVKRGGSTSLPTGVSLIRRHVTAATATYEVSSLRGLFEMARDDHVVLIRQVFEIEPLTSSSISLVRQDLLANASTLGAGKAVVVIETDGVAAKSAVEFGDCTAPSPTNCNLIIPKLGLTYPENPDVDVGHATNVAAIVSQMAPSTKVISVQTTLTWWLDDVLDWVTLNVVQFNIVAVNMSFRQPLVVCSNTPNQKFVSLRQLGVMPIAGSGNLGWSDKIDYPACDPSVLAVAATYTAESSGNDQTFVPPEFAPCTEQILTDKATCFSNMTLKVAVFAPGVRISAGGVTKTGTSQATPHVSGAVAALKGLYPR